MRRRLSIAVVATVTAALALSGVITLAVTVRSAQNTTRVELLRQAKGFVSAVHAEAVLVNRRNPAQSLRTVLVALRLSLRLDGEAVVAVDANGALYDPTTALAHAVTLPNGLAPRDIHPADLLAGRAVSGRKGQLVYAAVPYRATVQVAGTRRNELQAVVLVRRPPTGLASAGPAFLIAAVALIVLAALVANRLGHRFVRPLHAAEAVTARIAAGDLEARVPEPPGTDPELASLAASINTMAERLAHARGAERQFLLSVSHELRTPLTSIRGFAEAIEDGAVADTGRAATVIAAEARRLERLVRDLLVLAGIEARRFSLDLMPLDAAEVAAAGAAGFEPMADELGLRVSTEASHEPVRAVADPDRLAQVVANLVENALKYASGQVRVGAASPGGVPVVWVDDDGPGIAPEDLPRVFDRLFVSQRSGGRPVGTGLGLAIVAELVGAMGGSVRAESPLGPYGGTRMVVTLRPA
ncbi:HAMP domain-containing histidine kinase [Acidiferrimicrobium sp. IK]|uniref:sensor histidine kinase n=1 Tax=Acidiferrimicrobium sp. IK TaxID=2871700 RepID=UPI0021CAF051|nr:HAMP domain-containing sensor histidine kinase [Acidiferrimicrobium sp. IK]MCU4183619.1 HAMP domain-containing histidine kinase [Acidiferrimicrobium sp. IK]